VQYHPNNYKYAQQGAVSSSDRMLRLNVETIDTNRANIIKNRENLTKSKYFPNASGSSSSNVYDECCHIAPRVLVRQGTFILDITYQNGAFFRGINQRALSYSSTDDAPIPVIQNDFISVSATYQTIGLNPKKVRMTVNFDIFTNLNDSLLTIGLSFADYVDNYYNLYTSVLEIIQFGGMSLYGGGSQFAGLTPQILISAPDQPRIIPGTSALNCFMDCTNFNSPAIINWNIANIINLQGIFAYATLFNQPIGGWDTSNVANMSYMFYGASAFNQDISMLDTSAVEDMSHMFEDATIFNNGDISGNSDASLNWYAPNCTTFSTMFNLVSAFNQPIPFLVDTSGIALPTGCSLNAMFQNAARFNQNLNSWNVSRVTAMPTVFSGATLFNNGQTGTVDISGNLITSSASYINSSKLLTCPVGNFTTLTSANVLIITTPTLVYSSQIQTTPISDVSLVLLTAYGADILSGITSIKKQVAGTADLSWNTQLVTTTATMFLNATYFNQRLPWNMSLNRNVTSMFAATTSSPATPQKFINLFNNGQILTGNTQPLNPIGQPIWDFSGGTITGGTGGGWRLNSRLITVTGNGITANPTLT
jgi:surface protein